MTQTTQRRVGLLSPFLKRRRLQAVQPWLKGHILDFGCGYGGLAQYVTPDKYVGTDVDRQVLGVAEALFCFVRLPFL